MKFKNSGKVMPKKSVLIKYIKDGDDEKYIIIGNQYD